MLNPNGCVSWDSTKGHHQIQKPHSLVLTSLLQETSSSETLTHITPLALMPSCVCHHPLTSSSLPHIFSIPSQLPFSNLSFLTLFPKSRSQATPYWLWSSSSSCFFFLTQLEIQSLLKEFIQQNDKKELTDFCTSTTQAMVFVKDLICAHFYANTFPGQDISCPDISSKPQTQIGSCLLRPISIGVSQSMSTPHVQILAHDVSCQGWSSSSVISTRGTTIYPGPSATALSPAAFTSNPPIDFYSHYNHPSSSFLPLLLRPQKQPPN